MDDLRSLRILNEQGDTTLVWTPDQDEKMRVLIEQKMREGMQFFILEPVSDDPLNPTKIKIEAKQLDEAMRKRVVVMKDRDFANTVMEGLTSIGRMIGVAQEKLRYRAATSAQEVVQHRHAAATPRFHGG